MHQNIRLKTWGKRLVLLLLFGLLIVAIVPAVRLAAQERVGPEGQIDKQENPPRLPDESGLESSGEESIPFQAPADRVADTVSAVVLKSWGKCSTNSLPWDTLNANWSTYGSIPLNIDYDNSDLCNSEVTYEKLVASGADVLILSDPGDGGFVYSAAEIATIKRYAEEGHNLLGTYKLLTPAGNEALAPLFGLRSDQGYTTQAAAAAPPIPYQVVDENDPIFEGLSQPFESSGYHNAQVPSNDMTWDDNDLSGAHFIARPSNNKSAITFYPGNNYHAIYVANMTEYNESYFGSTQDIQFLYNAITYEPVPLYLPVVIKVD